MLSYIITLLQGFTSARCPRRFFVMIQQLVCLFSSFVVASAFTSAQDSLPVSSPDHGIRIAVAVESKSGQPVSGLTQHDFTVLENKSTRPIESFKVVSDGNEPIHVILLLDAVNMPYTALSYTRQSLEKYLRSNDGKLAYPTTLAILTDAGARILDSFSSDGNALSDKLHGEQIGLREINRASEWGWLDRFNISETAFHQLASFSAGFPGRKVVIWISPGWPLVSGPRIDLSLRQEQRIFDDVVSVSNQLRHDRLTIYNVNPWGVGEPLERTDYYEAFLKAPRKPTDVEPGDLSLQVLAVHSGGLAIESNSDVAGNIERCLAQVHSWYEIEFAPLPADRANEYHHIDIRLDQHGLTAHTNDGYYANPKVLESPR